MFPNMPDEVFDTWLLPIIRYHNAWPYSNVFSPHPSDQWRRYFGLFTLSNISHCLWDRLTLSFDKGCLDPVSNSTIECLIENHVQNSDATGRINVRDSKSRFFGFVEFIQRTGTIPAPIIGINTDVGLRVIDGNHRLSALTYLGLRGRINCDTWVGHPVVSEQ
jgi:hypothetical protein